MKETVWAPQGGAEIDQAIMEFLAGEDVVLDRELRLNLSFIYAYVFYS